MSQVRKDLYGVLKGLQMVASEGVRLQESYTKHLWANSSLKSVLDSSVDLKNIVPPSAESLSKAAQEGLQRSSMVLEGIKAFTSYVSTAPDVQKKEEVGASLAELDILEQDILNPNKPLEGIIDFESDSKPALSSNGKLLELEKGPIINSKKAATQAIFKTGNLGNVNLSPETSGIKEINPNQSPLFSEKIKYESIQSNPVLSEAIIQSQAPIYERRAPNIPNIVANTSKTVEINKSLQSKKFKQSLSETARERRVPSSRIGRMISFGGLAAGLGLGTIAEAARQTLGLEKPNSNLFLTPANAERIVNTLCKVRGAALKIGQLMSIQDNNVIDPTLQKAFERVRQAADFMPYSQVESVLREELGPDWRSKFLEFETAPFAAASIGQVHQGRLFDGSYVAVKIQYPGVAKGINSDIENLVGVMNLWNVFPEGMFLDKVVEVAKKELAWEVDYVREAECTRKFRKLLQPHPDYHVPKVVDDLCTARILTSELIEGVPVDKCADLDEETRTRICTLILHLCLRELFEWRYMQTDPNWSNFFYNTDTKKLILLDFGATRAYDKAFMDKYIEVVKAGADNDRQKVLEISREMGFLTGFESKAMENAHVDTVMILSEQFRDNVGAFDFGRQDATKRVTQLVPTILNHRLCPPPEEIYSLHRKLSGVFLLCAKMKVKLHCRPMLMDVYNKYVFG